MIKHGTFTSVWDMGEITTPATLDTENGHVETDSVEVSDEYEVLHSEYFTDEDGNEYKVCPECHEYIIKDVEFEHEGALGDKVCSNPYCPSQKLVLGREQAISNLVDSEIQAILEGSAHSDYSYVNDIFRDGFKGYDNFTDEELEAEYYEQIHEKIKIVGE